MDLVLERKTRTKSDSGNVDLVLGFGSSLFCLIKSRCKECGGSTDKDDNDHIPSSLPFLPLEDLSTELLLEMTKVYFFIFLVLFIFIFY